ncbi:MAG: hypothetical protein CMJ05_07510 [Pelagibacterales bacterium]|nr:hypothetical protein [Pelagibacterales bacterium]
MDLLDISLIFSITLCSLLSGFIFTYAIVVMPGLSNLNDKEFIRAFQVTDAVIQNNQPIFMFTWIGSIVSLLITILISVVNFGLSETWLIVIISVFYLLGVQGITIAIHIPLNNHIQKVIIEELSDEAMTEERIKFERKWNYFNNIRTSISILISLLLLILLSLR